MPARVVAALKEAGFDVARAARGSADEHVAGAARREGRVLVTFDSDFANVLAYRPAEFDGIVRVRIDPPFVSVVLAALNRVFKAFPTRESLRGRLVIVEASKFRLWDERPA